MTPKKYPAIAIVSPLARCAEVGKLTDTRILAAAAPKLPLPGCSMSENCRCRFQKFSDRRSDEQNRRFGYGGQRSAWYAGAQRRESPGRRTAD